MHCNREVCDMLQLTLTENVVSSAEVAVPQKLYHEIQVGENHADVIQLNQRLDVERGSVSHPSGTGNL